MVDESSDEAPRLARVLQHKVARLNALTAEVKLILEEIRDLYEHPLLGNIATPPEAPEIRRLRGAALGLRFRTHRRLPGRS